MEGIAPAHIERVVLILYGAKPLHHHAAHIQTSRHGDGIAALAKEIPHVAAGHRPGLVGLDTLEAHRHHGRAHPVGLVLILQQKAVDGECVEQAIRHRAAEIHPLCDGGQGEILPVQKKL